MPQAHGRRLSNPLGWFETGLILLFLVLTENNTITNDVKAIKAGVKNVCAPAKSGCM
jgi:hypothetical protein